MRGLYPMFPAPLPLCAIQWIDCNGDATPDCNVAIGLATCTANGHATSYPICAEHLVTLDRAKVHHDATCPHDKRRHDTRCPSVWTFEPFEPAFTCECVEVDGSALTRRAYLVTDHRGETSICHYCDDCAGLARIDWNGETASCVEVAR